MGNDWRDEDITKFFFEEIVDVRRMSFYARGVFLINFIYTKVFWSRDYMRNLRKHRECKHNMLEGQIQYVLWVFV